MSEVPVDDVRPFREPWEAHAFALVLSLHEQGVFTWPEWAEALASRIGAAHAAGDPDLGDTYYEHWLGALEDLVAERQLASADEIERTRIGWSRAAHRTPHGQPIELLASDLPG